MKGQADNAALPGRARRKLWRLALALALSLPTSLGSAQKGARVFTMELAQSRVTVTLTQEGLLRRRYATHLVVVKNFSGKITLPRNERQTAVELEAEAKSFTHADKEMSEFERRGFHDVLQNQVLESARFPTIKFKSLSVTDLKKRGAERSFTLNGELALRGVTKRVAFPVTVTIEKELLRASGEARLKQSDFGITPYAGSAGLIKVGDELTVSFSIVAKAL